MAKNMPSLSIKLNIWNRFGTKEFASLTKVVQKLLVCHATSCATEFVGPRVHSLSKCSRHITWQNLITICANSRQARENDSAVSLAVVEGDTEL
jgi:hypothetical protein